MAEITFENIRLALGEPNPILRQSLKASLFAKGFRGIVDCHDLGKVVECLDANLVDVLICDTGLKGGDFCQVVHRMRHHTLGNNPFLLAIATTTDATPQMVHRVIDSGVDDLLIKPVSIDQVLDRIGALARGRKPFIVTHDYIGPDRRKAERISEASAEQFEVPNPLRSKALSGNDGGNLQRIIDTAAVRLNERKMERYSVQIGFLTDRVLKHYDEGGKGFAAAEADLDRLLYVGEDLSRRLRGTNFAHVGELALSLVSLVQRFHDPGFLPDHVDGELLMKLGMAVRRAFTPEKSSVEAAQEINDAIANFANRE